MGNINVVVTLRVDGKEGLETILKYENTDIKTAILVEKTLLDAFKGLLELQEKGEV